MFHWKIIHSTLKNWIILLPVNFVERFIFLDYLITLDIQKCTSVMLTRKAWKLFLEYQRTVIPRTITTMPTCSKRQQQLMTAARQLPLLDPYGYGYHTTLSHPWVTPLWEESENDDTESSSGQQDDIATSSPFSPLMQKWSYQRCDQPLNRPSHRNKNSILLSV